MARPDLHAAPPCRQAIAQLLRAEKWADAVSMLLRFAASCDGAGARNSQCKAYLGAVVVWLYAGKANDAWVTYQVRGKGFQGNRELRIGVQKCEGASLCTYLTCMVGTAALRTSRRGRPDCPPFPGAASAGCAGC